MLLHSAFGSICDAKVMPLQNAEILILLDSKLFVFVAFKGQSAVETLTKWTPRLCFGQKLRDGARENVTTLNLCYGCQDWPSMKYNL